jgi:hypothetical protein
LTDTGFTGGGLDGYGAYVVENSGWVAELMEVNSVHRQYRAENWADARRFLFVFHDETVEAVARHPVIPLQTYTYTVTPISGGWTGTPSPVTSVST